MRIIDLIRKEIVVMELFLRSDVSATIVPGTLEAIAAGVHSFGVVVFPAQAAVYVFLYALTFTISNQLLTAEEDRSNGKLHRPLVQGIITVPGARVRLIAAMVIYLVFSAYTHVFLWSLLWVAVTMFLNFWGGSNHWFTKNLGMGIGTIVLLFVPWLLITGEIPAFIVPQVFAIAVAVFLLIGIQDLRDVEGDLPTRKTFPIAFGNSARRLLAVGFCILPIWTHLFIFSHPIWLGLPMDIISLVIAARLLKLRTKPADRVSYWLFTGWLSTATALTIVLFAIR